MQIDTAGTPEDWFRAANPLRRPRGMIEAARAARLAAFAIGLFAAIRAADATLLLMYPEQARLITDAALADLAPDPRLRQAMFAQVAPVMILTQVIGAMTWSVIAAALAFVQWRRMTLVLPAGLIALTLWGLASSGAVLALGVGPAMPPSLVLRDALAVAVYLALGVAAIRGARQLSALRRPAAPQSSSSSFSR